MVRMSVICEKPEVVREFTEKLKGSPRVGHIGKITNGFGSSAVGKGGYRDIKIYLQPMGVGHYAEVQVGKR